MQVFHSRSCIAICQSLSGKFCLACLASNTDYPFQISESALSTLQFIHRAGILHGDIRPENILIGDSGITIIDFGHSKQSDNKRVKYNEFAQLRRLMTL